MDIHARRRTLLLTIILAALTGFFSGGLGFSYFSDNLNTGRQNITTPKDVSVSKEGKSVTSVVQQSNPAVVSVIVKQDLEKLSNPLFRSPLRRRQQPDAPEQQIGGGTGFVVSQDGLIVTNKHVVNRDAQYTVLFNDGEKVDATVEALHPATDLALLNINRQGLEKLDLADSSQLRVGQSSIAIGNALGEFQNTVSKGIISGLNRDITARGGLQQTERLSGLIQTDAAVNPGNSGGPLLDINGNVVGVNVAVARQAQNIGFAIPSQKVTDMIEDFNQYGKIRVPFLGVRYVTINEAVQNANNLSREQGALLVADGATPAVLPNSPADNAGLSSGDIVLKINDTNITKKNPLAEVVEQFEVGKTVTLTYVRDGEEQTTQVTLQNRPQE